MTITCPDLTAPKVYHPQYDSRLLVQTMQRTVAVAGRRVLDLCTGSGYVAIAAAEMGCASATAFDICPHAVRSSRTNAVGAGVKIDVRQGPWTDALACAPFDVVVSNPPYVPTPVDNATEDIGPSTAWNAGLDGRLVLDPLCELASNLLCDKGSLLLVQSEFAGVDRTLDTLRSAGLNAEVVSSQRIPFGPVLSARSQWLEDIGLIPLGCREEEIVVVRADKR
ncbi:HemK2/MTQ2 family protein methyltransferase [Mycobacterium sp.]|uniref:HemK2/MTQ2 family protein methyltransferase n=1 Tax=Mycobacterium sp. TaxID=1785 RepID=UPI003C77BE7A